MTAIDRVAPRIVRIYTLRGFESVLAGSVQVSTGTKTSLSFQDGPVFTRVHRREGPAAPRGSDAGSSRENSYTPSPGASTTADWADWISATSNAKPARRAACFSSSQLSSIGRFGEIDRVLSEAGSDGRTISTSSYCPISARSGGTTSSSTASTSSTAVSCEAKGLAYKFARFWALPSDGKHN